MKAKIEEFLKEYSLENTTALVGFSGGADSCALIHILNSVKNDFNLKLVGIHLNHGWRKEESDRDEEFARKTCENLKIGFYSEKLSDKISKTETSARDARYEFFEKCAKKHNSNVVFLAHTRDDNIETAIFRFIKGTGPEGLLCIPQNREIFYRPMLDISKNEILKYLNENSIRYIEDSSNNDTKYKRNFIRHEILPKFREVNENADVCINNLIKVLKLEYEILNDKLDEIKKDIFKDNKIDAEKFGKLKKSYKMKIIQNYIKDDLKNPNSRQIEKIVDFIDETTSEKQDPQFRKWKKFSINSSLFLYVNKSEIFKGE